jgi:hypothetical protein
MMEKDCAAHLKTQFDAAAINIMKRVRRKGRLPQKAMLV